MMGLSNAAAMAGMQSLDKTMASTTAMTTAAKTENENRCYQLNHRRPDGLRHQSHELRAESGQSHPVLMLCR